LLHNGDPTLREHIANANRKDDGDKLRIVKRADHLKIDAAVAAAMACSEARRLNIG
jgi:phage terminase large subunit-like protein